MYNELYAAWQCEIQEHALGALPSDFYVRIADYLKRIKEEKRMLDKKSIKATLLEHETKHVTRMLKDLLGLRYKKLVKMTFDSQKVSSESLPLEEAKIFENFVPFTDAYQKFAKGLLQGQIAQVDLEIPHKRITLRFAKNVPGVIGVDMKTYGPFAVEDIASLPVENAKLLVKQGLAELVEIS